MTDDTTNSENNPMTIPKKAIKFENDKKYLFLPFKYFIANLCFNFILLKKKIHGLCQVFYEKIKINHRATVPRTVANHLFGKLEKSTYRQDSERLHREPRGDSQFVVIARHEAIR